MKVWIFCVSALMLVGPGVAAGRAQTPQQLVQQAVDTERAANAADHTSWIYLDETVKPKEQIVQWVASTQAGDVDRVLERGGQKIDRAEQVKEMDAFLHDGRAQKKQLSERAHDNQQVDDLLKLLPEAFLWTKTSANETETTLHFLPAPGFRPPTRESHVFAEMTGDLVIDNAQHRVRSMQGRLLHDVTFGGGLLGRLRQGSSFALEQAEVGPAVWQLTAVHVHLDGSALLFKSISLVEDETRSRFSAEPPTLTLGEAEAAVMTMPAEVSRR